MIFFKKNSPKKILLSTILLVVFAVPHTSFAVFGVGDIVFDTPAEALLGALNGTGATTTEGTVANEIKTYVLDGLAYSVAQKLSQKLVAMTLNAVNGGASQNKPASFIENFGKYFSDIAGKEISNYTNKLDGSKNPFAQMISQGLSDTASGFSKTGLDSFSLDKTLPKDVSWQDASQDISKAGNKGWDFYSQLAFPENNSLGSGLIAQTEIANKIQKAQETAKIELTSSGFTPQKGKDSIAGALELGSQKAQKAIHNGIKQSQYNNIYSSDNLAAGDKATDTMDQQLNGDLSGGAGGSFGSDTCSGDDCPQLSPENNKDYSNVQSDKKIQTPGASVTDNTTKSTQEAGDRLKTADQFFKLIFAALTQIIGGLVDKGISSLTSDAGSANPNQYGSPTDIAKLSQGSKSNWNKVPEEIIDFRNELNDAAIKTTLDVAYTSEIIKVLRRAVTGNVPNSSEIKKPSDIDDETLGTSKVLLKLEACIPGPSMGYMDRMQGDVQTSLKDTKKRASGDDEKSRLNARAADIIERQFDISIQNMQLAATNPLLNLPGMSTLQDMATSYYKNSKSFQRSFTKLFLKKQAVSRVNNIIAQVRSYRDSMFKKTIPLVEIPTVNDTAGDPLPKECPTGYQKTQNDCNRTMVMPPMFDDEWSAMTQADKESLYKTLSPDILKEFPDEYGELP